MPPSTRLLSTLAAALALATAAPAWAQDDRPFLFTGDGVAEGTGRLALGLDAVIAFSGDVAGGIPALDIRYARGLTGPLDLRLSLDTLGVYNAFDAGVGIALVRGGSFGLGLRAGVTGLLIISATGGGGVVAATPGLVASLRAGSSAAISLGVDLPLYFNGVIVTPSDAQTGLGVVPSVRPNVAIELGGDGDGAKFYIHGDATIFFTSGATAVLANAGLGVHF